MTTLPAEAASAAQRRASGFRPIADYGLLADCNSAALVDRDGSIDWLCLPRYDSPAVFARILDPDAGHWSIRPAAPCTSERRYLPGTLVIETTFTTDAGAASGWSTRWPSPPGQRGHDLGLRRAARGAAPGRGRRRARSSSSWSSRRGRSTAWSRRCSALEDGGGRTFGGPTGSPSRSGVPVDGRGRRRCARASPSPRASRSASRCAGPPSRSARPMAAPAERVAARIDDTVEAWRSWEAEHDIYEGPHRELVRLSARVLKGLTYRPTGAIVAAPTTSLPETVGGERNWDYRFSWIRDSSLTLEALYIGACSDEAEEFVSFMTSSAGGRAGEGSLQIMYGIGGEHDLSERELAHLRGWRDSRAGARRQRRLGPDAARRLRRAAQRAAPLPRAPRRAAPGDPAVRRRPRRHRRAPLARDRLGHLGDARRAAPPPLLQGHVLGRRSTAPSSSRPQLGEHAKVEAWAAERDEIRAAILDARLERGAAGVRAVLRLRRARRRAAADADLRLPARRPTRACARRSRRSRAS